MTLKEEWMDAVKRKKSVLCAGLDPADFEMNRGDEGIPEGANKLVWAEKYIEAVAPFCAAVKPNIQYWKGLYDSRDLEYITTCANHSGMVVIRDDKLADIGSTNDAGMFHIAKSGADAFTLAPFAGNMKEAAEQGRKRNLGVIAMCLMSNPEYEAEKNKLVAVGSSSFSDKDVIMVPMDNGEVPHVRQYIKLAHDAKEFGIDGIVIGAPSKKNHIKDYEIANARHYAGDEMLVLLPGVGAQGGEAGAIWKYFAPENVIVNVGRAVMFPKGSNSTPKEQAEAAEQYMNMLNDLRKAA